MVHDELVNATDDMLTAFVRRLNKERDISTVSVRHVFGLRNIADLLLRAQVIEEGLVEVLVY